MTLGPWSRALAAARRRPAVAAALRQPLVAVRVVVVVTYLRWALPRRGLPHIVDRLQSRAGHTGRRADGRLTSLAAAIVRRWPINHEGDCLAQSLVAFHLASRRGQAARVHCGVKPNLGTVVGHAWATVDDVELYGTSRDGHLEMLVLPQR